MRDPSTHFGALAGGKGLLVAVERGTAPADQAGRVFSGPPFARASCAIANLSAITVGSWVASVWASHSGQIAEMTSVATETWGLVFWEHEAKAYASITGPETGTSTVPVPAGAAFLGIQFAVGTSLRMTPTSALVDSGIDLPDPTRRRFWLDGERWQTPAIDDAESLVEFLVQAGTVVRDPLVAAVLN